MQDLRSGIGAVSDQRAGARGSRERFRSSASSPNPAKHTPRDLVISVRAQRDLLPRIELSLHIAAAPEICFDLARSVEAHVHSTASTGERAVGGKVTGLLELGDEITWRARHLGISQELTSRITAYDRPRHFRDSMVRGAFASFQHDHFFAAAGGGTLVRDVFDFRAPFGPLGWLAERVFLTRYMRHFLSARLNALKQLAESDEWYAFVPSA